MTTISLYGLLDTRFDAEELTRRLEGGIDPNTVDSATGEPPLFTATRRRRLEAVEILLAHGADPDQPGPGGKTPWVHAIRRGFEEVSDCLADAGCRQQLTQADRLAVALSRKELDQAQAILNEHPEAARTGNPEEDRLLADMAGRMEPEPVRMLIDAGAPLDVPGLDDGTPLHCAAWFGQAVNARMLLDAGAPVDVFDSCHEASPLHWAIHGARYSGGAEQRQDAYVELTRMLLEAGSRLTYPPELRKEGIRSYVQRMWDDATPVIEAVLRDAGIGGELDGGPAGT